MATGDPPPWGYYPWQWGSIPISPQAGPDNGDVRVDGMVKGDGHKIALISQAAQLRRMYEREYLECQNWRRLYEAKSIECARLQKRVEELEGRG